MVTSLAVNNYDLQCSLVKNGVLWSLLLFAFEYDYTLDESGVSTSEKSNSQKVANNLAKMSILACVALSGYELLKNDRKVSIKPTPEVTPKNSIKPNPNIQSVYTQNAQNLIQNSKQLVQSISTDSTSSANFKSYVEANEKAKPESPSAKDETKVIEKENIVSNQKYLIGPGPKNLVVKKILDKLLTTYISNKLAIDHENEVITF